MHREKMEAIIEKILAKLTKKALIRMDYNQEGLTRFASSEIHQNVVREDLNLTLQLREGKRESIVSTNRLDDEGIFELVREGEAILDLVPEGEIEVPLVEEPAEISWEERDPKLVETYTTMRRAESIKEGVLSLSKGSTASGTLSLDQKEIMLANTEGMRRFLGLDTIHFSTVVTSGEGSGFYQLETQSSGEMDPLFGFSVAQEKAKMCGEPLLLPPGKYTVILEPLAVSTLLTYMAYAGLSGRRIQQGSSFLINKKGERVFQEDISIYDDYQGEGTYGIPFDFEGVPKRRVDFIQEGIAKDVVYDLRSAAIEGLSSTGHSVGDYSIGGFPINLFMAPGDKEIEEMIAETERGLLITRFHYTNIVNPRQLILTGLTRDGTFLIENGELKGGIRDMRFTESLLVALNQVEAIGKTLYKRPQFFGVNMVPALKIKDFTFSGVCKE